MAEQTLVDHLLARRRALARPAPPGRSTRRRAAADAHLPRGRAALGGVRPGAARARRRGGRPGGGDARQPAGVPARVAGADAARARRWCRSTCATARATPATSSRDAGARLAVTSPAYADLLAPLADGRRSVERPGARRRVAAGPGRPGRAGQRAVHLGHDRAPEGLRALAPLLDDAGRRDGRGVPAPRRGRRDADRAAVLLPRPAVERRRRADGRRRSWSCWTASTRRRSGRRCASTGSPTSTASARCRPCCCGCRPTRSTATTGCAPCSARRSRPRCTPSSRSGGASPWYEAFGMTETGADIRVTARRPRRAGRHGLPRPAGRAPRGRGSTTTASCGCAVPA